MGFKKTAIKERKKYRQQKKQGFKVLWKPKPKKGKLANLNNLKNKKGDTTISEADVVQDSLMLESGSLRGKIRS